MAAAEEFCDDEDVPPLEDIPHLMTNLEIEQAKDSISSNRKTQNPFLEVNEPTEAARFKKIQTLLNRESHAPEKANDAPLKKQVAPKDGGNAFGGFKKGFLLGTKKGPKASEAKNIEEIKPKTKQDPLVLSEVQDAIAAQMPLLQSKDWIDADLLTKIEKNPKLFKQLQDPRFSQALSAMQTNPQQAMVAFKDNPEIKEFIQEFCGILGEHFENLGEKETKTAQEKVENETLTAKQSRQLKAKNQKSSSEQEEARMRKILSDPEIQEILSDDQIQKLISSIREDPIGSQRMLATLGPEIHIKIQRLIEAGVLGVARK